MACLHGRRLTLRAASFYKTDMPLAASRLRIAAVLIAVLMLLPVSASAGTTSEEVKLFNDYKQKAESGSAFAQLKLALCYSRGEGVASDDKLAYFWYRKSAEQGNEHGQEALGDCYASGRGVEADDARAFRWYRKAAEQGLSSAQLKSGYCYELGKGAAKDMAKASDWYRAAAAQLNVRAQIALGRCYSKGLGVARIPSEGYAYFCLASRTSDEARLEFIGLREQMSFDEISEGINRAKELLLDEIAMTSRPMISINGSAMHASMGDGLRLSKGGAESAFASARNWYIDSRMASARSGDARAQFDIGTSFALGDGVKADVVKGHAYLSISGLAYGGSKAVLAELEKKMKPEELSEARELAVQLKKGIQAKAGKAGASK